MKCMFTTDRETWSLESQARSTDKLPPGAGNSNPTGIHQHHLSATPQQNA